MKNINYFGAFISLVMAGYGIYQFLFKSKYARRWNIIRNLKAEKTKEMFEVLDIDINPIPRENFV